MTLLNIVIFVLAFLLSLGLVLWAGDVVTRLRSEEEVKVFKRRLHGRPRKTTLKNRSAKGIDKRAPQA